MRLRRQMWFNRSTRLTGSARLTGFRSKASSLEDTYRWASGELAIETSASSSGSSTSSTRVR